MSTRSKFPTAANLRELGAQLRAIDARYPALPPSALGAAMNAADDDALRALQTAPPPDPRATPEKAILAGIIRALDRAGFCAHRMTSGVFRSGDRTIRTGEQGMPDVLVELPRGRCAWLEVKSDTGVVSHAQAEWHAKARARGQSCAVVRGVDEALAFVRGLG